MAVRNTPAAFTFEEWRVETNEIATDAGDVSLLQPSFTATDLTNALLELKTSLGNATLQTSASNHADAINELHNAKLTSVTMTGDTEVANTAFSGGLLSLASVLSTTVSKNFVRVTGKVAGSGFLNQKESVTSGTTTTIDCSLSEFFAVTFNQNTTMSFSNVPGLRTAALHEQSGVYSYAGVILELTNAGNYTISWPSGVKWGGGAPPTFTSNGTDIIVLTTHDGGSTWRAIVCSLDSK